MPIASHSGVVMKEIDALNTTKHAEFTISTQNSLNSPMTDEDWFNVGKSDAWTGKPKLPPEQDSQAASMYDLGYCEGCISSSPIDTSIAD